MNVTHYTMNWNWKVKSGEVGEIGKRSQYIHYEDGMARRPDRGDGISRAARQRRFTSAPHQKTFGTGTGRETCCSPV